MSADILNRVWKAAPPNLTSFHRLLLVRLAWYVDDSGGNCFASVATLAHDTGATERGVRSAMSELRGKGLVLIEVNAGPNRTNRIALSMSSIEAGEPLNGGASLHGGAGVNGGAGEPLNGGAGNPAPPCTSTLNGGSANRQERQERQKKDSTSADAQCTPGKKAARVSSVDLPAWLSAEEWDAFLSMRTAKGRRYSATAHAQTLILKKLDTWYGEGLDALASLRKSTVNNWQDVFKEHAPQRAKQWVALTPEEQEREWDDVRGITREVLQ